MRTSRQFRLSSFVSGLSRPAFTLVEMVVSISILVIVILAVGVIFKAAGRAVGVSQASMEMLSNDRAIQQQLQSDVSGIDKNGFLVIRSAIDPSNSAYRFDQISFISFGSFVNRGGTTSSTPLTDNDTISPAAFIWWGQLAVSSNQASKLPLNQLPDGATDDQFLLGRRAMLLSPKTASTEDNEPNGTFVDCYQNSPSASPPLAAIDYSAPTTTPLSDGATDITEARLNVASCTPAEIMSYLAQAIAGSRGSTNARYEADHYCYRIGTLRSPYDSPIGILNGYFRMTPIALQGVSSFAIEWTDGSVYAAGDTDPITGNKVATGDALIGTTRWYGYGNPKAGTGATLDPSGGTGNTNGDVYCAVFSYDNRSLWPVALRFRYHVVDASGRIPNGRDFTEVVKLPN